MGSCVISVLANVILTEFVKQIIKDQLKSGTIKFYCRKETKRLMEKMEDVSGSFFKM